MIITNRIRVAFNGLDGIKSDRMEELAEQYDAETEALNTRLIECVSLLRKGLRSEAIQLATTPPDALDLAAELEFPEVNEWIDVLKHLRIDIPSRVNRNAVLQINEAIFESQPIEHLLKTHRRLAIARAPLSLRLTVLRRIAKVDASNPVWLEDIRKWEIQRVKEIPNEFSKALEEEDWFKIESLHNELVNQKWIHQPLRKLVIEIQTAHQHRINSESFSQLNDIADELHKAFCEKNHDRCKSLRAVWKSKTSKQSTQIPSKALTKVKEVFAWMSSVENEISNEIEQANAIEKLESLVGSSPSIFAIKRAYQNAIQFGLPLPDEIEQSYTKKIRKLESRALKRKLAMGAMIVLAATTLLVYIAAVIHKNRVASEQALIAKQLQVLFDSDDYRALESRLDMLSLNQPEFYEQDEIQAIASQLRARNLEIALREKKFEETIEQADHEDPARIRVNLLDSLEAEAESDVQRDRISQIRQRRSAWEREQTVEQAKLVVELIAGMKNQLQKSPNGWTTEEQLQRISGISEQIDSIAERYPFGAAGAQKAITSLREELTQRLTSLRQQIARKQSIDTAMRQIQEAVTLESLKSIVQANTSKDLPDAMRRSFGIVAAEAKFWHKAEEFNLFLAAARKITGAPYSSSQLASLSTQLDTLKKQTSGNEVFDEFDYLITLSQQYMTRESLVEEIIKNLENSLDRKLTTLIPANSQDRFFITEEVWQQARKRLQNAQPGQIHGVDRIADEILTTDAEQVETPVTIYPEPKNTIEWVIRELKSSTKIPNQWNEIFRNLILEVLRRENLDSQVKIRITRDLLRICTAPEASSNNPLTETSRNVDSMGGKMSYEQWLEPQPLQDEIPLAWQPWLEKDLSESGEEPKEQQEALERSFEQQIKWVGVIYQHENGDIKLHTKQSLSDEGILYVLQRSSTETVQITFTRIGVVENQDPMIGDAPLPALIPGRPVFLLSPIKKP